MVHLSSPSGSGGLSSPQDQSNSTVGPSPFSFPMLHLEPPRPSVWRHFYHCQMTENLVVLAPTAPSSDRFVIMVITIPPASLGPERRGYGRRERSTADCLRTFSYLR